MQAIVFADLNDTRFYLTSESLASDISERASTFRDLTDAALRAIKENTEGWLRGATWQPAYRMSNGTIVPPDYEFESPD